MKKSLLLATAIAALFLGGCASVPMESKEASNKAKEFALPTGENAGLYIYRSSILGAILKKDIWVDDECLGETAPNMFFYKSVKGGEEHKIATESEFSPNELFVKTEAGHNYFVEQYIRMGVFVGGANLELVDPEKGKKAVSKLGLAEIGTCSK